MTDFMITAPDGKKYKVSGPDQAGALAALKKFLGVQPADDAAQAKRARLQAAKDGTLEASPESLKAASAADQIAEDRAVLSGSPAALNALTKFNQGIPFVGEYTDELTGVFSKPAMERQRAVMAAMDRENPKTSMALQMAGGITGSIPLAAAAAPAVIASAPATVVGKAAVGGLAAGTAGAIEGGISGYGRGNDGDRAKSAGTGAMVGGALGVVIGAAAPAVAKGVKAIAETMKGRDVGTISRVLGISDKAARVVKANLEADDFVGAERALKRAGADAMLADAGPVSAQMLDTAAQSGGAASRIARTAVDDRANAANKRLTQALDMVLGKPEGVKAGAREIATRTAAVRKSAYDRAYSSAINYADDTGRGVEAVLDRIPPKTLNAAISEANDAMRAAGVKNMQIMAEIAPDGSVVFREMPNVQQLDEIKKALGAIAQKETDPLTGRITGAGVRAKKLASELRDATADAVPAYRTAVKLGGDKIAEDQALDLGRNLLKSGTTREQVAEAMQGASKEATAAAQKGLRTYIDDTLANVQRTITDPNIDAREAMKVVKDMSSRASREKMEAVLGPAKAKTLFQAIDEATAHLELRAATARNSATAARLAGKSEMDAAAEPGALGTLLEGEPLNAGKKIVQALTGRTDDAKVATQQALYAEIAQALTQKRGPEAERALKIVQDAIAGQPMRTEDAIRISRALTTGAALTSYQSGQKYLTNKLGAR